MISPSWCLVHKLERLRVILLAHLAISFHHIRRESNKVADCLANAGVECRVGFQCDRLDGNEEEDWAQQCSHLAARDLTGVIQMDDQMDGRTDGVRWREHAYTWPS